MTIFLVGYMGCGKSTIGRMLAPMLGARFMDMDTEIERRAGMAIAEIFARQGEAAFREMERDFLANPIPEIEGQDLVIATGGGAPCHGDNIEIMKAAGHVAYLKMSPERLLARLGRGREKRPLIKGMDDAQLLKYITENVEKRAPHYEKAHLTIDCDGVADRYIAEHISRYIKYKL